MKGSVWLLLCLIAGWSRSLVVDKTSCTGVICEVGQECQIVDVSGVTAALCIDSGDVPHRNGCGSSGFPVLKQKIGRNKTKYNVLSVTEHMQKKDASTACPAPFVLKRSRCCFDTEKSGACPPNTRSVYDADITECSAPCKGDNCCQGNEKCCGTSCDGMFCADPVFSSFVCNTGDCIPGIPCAIVDCAPGFMCVTIEPGIRVTCERDPRLTCAAVLCIEGTTCVATPSGPECLPTAEVGTCPALDCIPGTCPSTSECESDADCRNGFKCCVDCSGCSRCLPPKVMAKKPPSSCENVTCPSGQQCVLQEVICVTTPCDPVPTCVDKEKPGECPEPSGFGICAVTCQNDDDCVGANKCCPTACGKSTAVCTQPKSCADMRCNTMMMKCIETDKGPRCILQKPGTCSLIVCDETFDASDRGCLNQCEEDSNCTDNAKCCSDCRGCLVCREPARSSVPDLCANVTCADGEMCKVQRVNCVFGHCQPVATCIATGDHLGQCPKPGAVGTCAIECEKDNDCERREKCCSTACGGTTCVPAAPLDSCDKVKCPGRKMCLETYDSVAKGQYPTCFDRTAAVLSEVCSRHVPLVLTSSGRQPNLSCSRSPSATSVCPPGYECQVTGIGRNVCCRISTKAGSCPMTMCRGLQTCTRSSECVSDPDCPGKSKCCQGCGGCRRCFEPVADYLELSVSSCGVSMLCSEGYQCVDSSSGPSCRPIIKPGQCALFKCPSRGCETQHECTVDNDCQGNLKCCSTCTGCRQCLCGSRECQIGEECRLSEESTLSCVSRAITEAQCPTSRAEINVTTCGTTQCDFDSNCTVTGEKCCPTRCGGTACTRAILPSTCDTALWPLGLVCREVYDLDSVTPQFFAKPPMSLQDEECKVGLPLLFQANASSGGEVTQANCGSERDAISCPNGYSCKIGSGGAFSVCCRDTEQPCDPPCGPSATCDTTVINCITTPCPPSPRCVPVDACLLPKIVGPCEALIPSYYYNNDTERCERFNYGGCGGNGNRFDSKKNCQKACAEHICSLPKDMGESCASAEAAAATRYYYCPECDEPKCRSFSFNGCGGNGNRFLNQTTCEDVCLVPIRISL